MSEVSRPAQVATPDTQWLFGLAIVVSSLAVVLAVAIGVPASVIVLCVVIVVFLLAVYRVSALFFAAVFFLPLEPVLPTGFVVHDFSVILHVTMLLGLCVGSFMEGRSLRKLLHSGPLTYLAIVFGIVSLASAALFNHASVSSQGALLRLFSYLCFYFVIVGWLETEEQVETVIGVLLLSTTIVAVFGLYQAAIGDMSDLYFWIYPKQAGDEIVIWTGRITSFLNYYNSLAGYLNLVLPFALAFTVVRVTSALRAVAVSCLAGGTIVLVLTQSRGGVFAFGGTLLLALSLLVGKSKNRKGLILSLVIALCVALPFLVELSSRFGTIEDDSGLMRYALWALAGAMFLSSPIIGIGYGNFRDLYRLPGFESGIFDVHNLYLQLLTETGILGFIVFMVLVVVAFQIAWSQFKRAQHPVDQLVGFAAIAALASVLTHGFVDYLFIVSPQFGALFWMILGILTARQSFQGDLKMEGRG